MTESQCVTCGDMVAWQDTEGNGRCCHKLPNPWHRSPEGLYNEPTSPDSDAEALDHDPEEQGSNEDTPHCHECGSRRWIIRFGGVTTSESEYGDRYVYYEDVSECSASCAQCDADCRYSLEAS